LQGDETIRIAIANVGSIGPEHEDATKNENESRLEASKQAIERAFSLQADILVLPGGFLVCRNSESKQNLAESLIDRARCLEIAVAFGVDDYDLDAENRGAYGFAWSPTEDITHCWKQRSSTRWDKIPPSLSEDAHLLRIGSELVSVLICGEIFNKDILAALNKKKPKIVIDLIHVGQGFRVHGAMRRLSENAIASACSLHAKSQNAVKRCYIPIKGNMSTRNSDAIIRGPPRIEIKSFEIP
jgi:hypothetical protein